MVLHQLNRERGDNRYCGPAVVSFLTGLNTSEVARQIREATGRRMITGTDVVELQHVLLFHHMVLEERSIYLPPSSHVNVDIDELAGFAPRINSELVEWQMKCDRAQYLAAARPTLAAWLREHKGMRTSGRVYLLAAGNHWQLITGFRYACGQVGEIVSVRDPRVRRRARVSEVYEVIKC
tara:strand:+ start:649 stop:1188 length:540 start_codon:yes stop_codon:yes gene_type:complete